MTLGARLALAATCLAGSALITWAIYDPSLLRVRNPGVVVRERIESAAPAASSTLWLLAVGVSKYESTELILEFADRDAEEIARALRAAARGGRYREVKSMVLTNDQVTRASLLDGLANFLGNAGPDDVAALFFAGHGVRDLSSGSYYFLPHPASTENLLTEGLRMSDFDEMLRIVRRNVRAVVVMLDTCHAGAFGLSSNQVVSADEMAAQMSAGEGFFLLAASRPGEESKEEKTLGHGAFTYSILEALEGKADADGDGALSVSELFGYVAKRVPALTGGQQHPYSKTEGTDLVLVSTKSKSVASLSAAPAPGRIVERIPTPLQDGERSNSIAVLEFENLRAERDFDWISKALRVRLRHRAQQGDRPARLLAGVDRPHLARARRRLALHRARARGRTPGHRGVPRHRRHPAHRRAHHRRRQRGQRGFRQHRGQNRRLLRPAEEPGAEHAAPTTGPGLGRRRRVDPNRDQHRRRRVPAAARIRRPDPGAGRRTADSDPQRQRRRVVAVAVGEPRLCREPAGDRRGATAPPRRS